MDNNLKIKISRDLLLKIGGGLVATILIIAIVFSAKFFVSPKTVVAQALNNSMEGASNPVIERLGLKETLDSMYTQPRNISASFSVDDINNADFMAYMEGSGFRLDAATDYRSKKTDADVYLQWGGADLMNFQYYAFDDTIGLSCPDLYEGYISIDAKNIGQDYTNSVFYNPSAVILQPNQSITLFGDYVTSSMFEYYKNIYQEDYDSLIRNITVGNATEVPENAFPDLTTDYSTYKVTIPNEDAQTLVFNIANFMSDSGNANADTTLTEFGNNLLEDVVILVAVDDSNRLVGACYIGTLSGPDGESEVTSHLTMTGKEDVFSTVYFDLNIDGSSQMPSALLKRDSSQEGSVYSDRWNLSYSNAQTGYVPVELGLTSTYDLDKDSMDFTAGVYDLGQISDYILSGTADFSNIAKGESLSVDFSDLVLDSPTDNLSLSFSGDLNINSENVTVESPSGEPRPLLVADMDYVQPLIDEISQNLQNSAIMNAFY